MRLFNFGRKEKKGTKSKGWRKRRHVEPRSYTVEDKVKILKEYEVAEPAPPVNDWSVKNSGTLLKRDLPLKEVLISGDKQLNLVSQKELQQVGFHSVGLGTTLTEDRNKLQSIPFKVRLDRVDEAGEKVTFRFSILRDKGILLKKRIVLTGKEIIYEYEYLKPFDKLVLTDAFSMEHIFHPVPDRVVFRKGRMARHI